MKFEDIGETYEFVCHVRGPTLLALSWQAARPIAEVRA